ncbi:hypothetical protein ACFL22_00120 [Patescibacteria group bacterium]
MKYKIFVISVVMLLSACVKVTDMRADNGHREHRQSTVNNQYGLPEVSHQRIFVAGNNFARPDVTRMMMDKGHFFGEEEVSNIFRRSMPESISTLPYKAQTLQAYADNGNCFVSLVTDYANARNPTGSNPASVKNLVKLKRFGRYLRSSLRFLQDKNALFLTSRPQLGWQLTCFESLHVGEQLRRIIPTGNRVMSAAEIVQLMLLSPDILKGKNVVSSDRSGVNHVIVSRAKNGKITILLRNHTKANDVLALGIKYDQKRRKHRR